MLIRRPAIWILASLLIILSFVNLFDKDILYERYYILDKIIDKEAEAKVEARISYTEKKNNSIAVYLKNVKIKIKDNDSCYHLSNLLAYTSKLPKVRPGNKIVTDGTVMSIESPTNPGQFNQREYYKEKNIYYTFICSSFKITDKSCNIYMNTLQEIKAKISGVYKSCLPQKEYGIINAMMLGDKSILDMDIRKLYQANGIGHLLAISALHITIICTGLYNLLLLIKIPRNLVSFITIFTLIAYGNMTGFSISTSRAVIAMIISISAVLIGRSYDSISAFAISAIIIIIQKPFSLMSCSFILSYASALGIIIIYPKLLLFIYGGEAGIRHNKRVMQRKLKEGKNDKISAMLRQNICAFKVFMSESFLAGISIQLSTIPVILYFFYEYPLYSIFINLIIIPLASLLVSLSAIGGIIGIFCIPAARFILGGTYYLLKLYEGVCNFFNKLPNHIIVTGRPALVQIVIYYSILVIILFLLDKNSDNMRFIVKFRINFVLMILFSFMLIFHTNHYKGLYTAFLDVGQGDCIFIRSPSGTTYLIDGGSSSVKSVGEYRILPFLRYNGIDCIDYMIITHSDEDHVSGLKEILNQSDTGDIDVRNLVLPNPSKKCKDSSYNDMISLAHGKNVEINYINTGDQLRDEYIDMMCLNPVEDFESESVNAYSTVLSLVYGKTSCLLTGDMEKEGEEAVYDILTSKKGSSFPEKYNVLKVAHHGSRNSSSKKFLDIVSPDISIISCGKNNRYSHPHKELLERLENVSGTIIRTDINGAVILKNDGINIEVSCCAVTR